MTAEGSVFLYGTLRYPPLLRVVLGREAVPTPAAAPGNKVVDVGDRNLPALIHAPGGRAEGLLLTGLGAEDMARLDFYELGFGYRLEPIALETPEGPAEAMAYRAEAEPAGVGDWDLAHWIAAEAAATMPAALEFMALFGTRSPEAAAFSYAMIRKRADSRLRAARSSAPVGVRRGFGAAEVEVAEDTRPYTGFFALQRTELTHPRFDGAPGRRVVREALVAADAVTVLPYDPVRDRVLLVEQFRFGPFARGDTHPWTLEPIAGHIDPGETPEDAARREAQEEAGLALGKLWRIGAYYPSPGAFTEFIYSYVARADLPDGAGGGGGLDGEDEDIHGHVLPFERLMALVAEGEANTGPLILSANWLAANRDLLRG